MNAPHDGDTEPSGPPVDPDMIDAIAADLAKLRDVAQLLGGDLAALVAKLELEAEAMRRGHP